MLDPTTATATSQANLGDTEGTPVWPASADQAPNLYAQPPVFEDAMGADKFEKPVGDFPSAEGRPEAVDSAASEADDADTSDDACHAKDATPPATRGRGRPKEFTDFHKGQVCGLIGAGISQRQAAAYLGFSPSMVATALRRDKQFAADVARAVVSAKFQPLYKVIKASEHSWRAAIWLVENAQPHTDLADREARRAARRAEKVALKQAEIEREARRRRQQEHVEEFKATEERLRPK